MNFLGMGPLELLLILALALVVFGPDKLPDIARQLGRSLSEFRRVTSEVRTELRRNLQLDDELVRSSPAPPGATTSSTGTPAAPPHASTHSDDLQPPY